MNTQFRHTLIYGSATGGVMAFLLFLMYLSGSMNNKSLDMIIYSFFAIGVFFSVKHYRDRYMGGVLNFGTAYGTAILTCLFIGLVGAFYNYLLYSYMAPGLWEQMLIEMEEQLLSGGMSDDQVELQRMMIDQFMSPAVLGIGILFYSVFLGGLLSLGVASMLRRRENPMITNNQ